MFTSNKPRTLWIDRFIGAFTLLCGGNRPPQEAIDAWFNPELDDSELQAFALEYSPLDTAQGIAIVEAAEYIADHPQECGNHEYRD